METLRGPAATVEAYTAALGRRDLAGLEDLVAPDVVAHEPAHETVGFEAFKENIAGWLTSYEDLRIATEDLLECGDRAAWRWRLEGTHAPTGRRVAVGGIIIFRVDSGRIAEYWGHYDRLGMLQQQGLLP